MSNLAVKYSAQPQRKQQEIPVKREKQVIKQKKKITLGEKCLGILLISFIMFAGIKIVSNQFAIYNMNKEIQVFESTANTQEKVNNDLHVEKESLSSYERILTKAKELGLKLNEKNVKVIQD
jgi:cell division protein FtsL